MTRPARRAVWALALGAAILALPSAASAAVIPVDTTADPQVDSGTCSLRQAVLAAGADAATGGCPAGEAGVTDQIQLPAGVHVLALEGRGEDAGMTGDLDLDTSAGDVSITGASAASTAIDGDSIDRVLDVSGDGDLTLSDLRVQGGQTVVDTMVDQSGGGIRWRGAGGGSLHVSDAELAGNFGFPDGGAISADVPGAYVIARTLIHDNDSGGGAVRTAGSLSISDSTIATNNGGGVVADGDLEMTGSTVTDHDNTDTGAGGIVAHGHAVIERSTIINNTGGYAGGIEADGTLEVRYSTIAFNRSPTVTTFPSAGISAHEAVAATVEGSILAGNYARGTETNCDVEIAEGPAPNLDGGTTCGFDAPGSLSKVDPGLAPLAAYGGPTPTAALYADSPAIDAGPAACTPATDQRGVGRPLGAACDLGAFEGSIPRPVPDPVTEDPQPQPLPAPCKKHQKRNKKGKCVKRKKPKRKKPRSRAAAGGREVIGRSVRGHAIVARQLGDPDGKRVALAVGLIHGDERAGLGVLRRIPRDRLDGTQLWVIPTVNPDGTKAHTRKNARGVDLNRNFPFRWRGGVPKASGYYPGRAPASEPETRALMAFVERIRPDVSVWYHQPWGAVLACRGRPAIAARYAKLAGMRSSCRGKGLRGTAIGWQNDTLGGDGAFVVEFAAGALPQRIARRHANALAIIASDG